MNYRLAVTLGIVAIAAVLFPNHATSAESDYIVIVHGQSPISSIRKTELNDVYLKKIRQWKNGTEADPIDLGATHPARARFSQEILGRNVAAVQAYWRKLIFSGKAVPPIELPLDGDVLNYVSNHRGAIGYISASTYTEAANVKKIKLTD